MSEVFTQWITAEVTLLPRVDGREQRPPVIFTGYRNSHLLLEGWTQAVGGAQFFVRDREHIGVWETGSVLMHVYFLDSREDDL